MSYGKDVKVENLTSDQIERREAKGDIPVYVQSWKSYTFKTEAEKAINDELWKINDQVRREEAEM